MSPNALKNFRASEQFRLFMQAVSSRNYAAARAIERQFEILWKTRQGIPQPRGPRG